MTNGSGKPVLSVKDLKTVFRTQDGTVHAVNGVSFDLKPGELLGVVGESGSGKSVTMMSLTQLIPMPPAEIVSGSAEFDGRDLLKLSLKDLQELRGGSIGFAFQDPMTSLNPVFTVGYQIMEPLRAHLGLSGAAAKRRAVELLELVGIPDAERRLKDYPHQFSGGMRQRVMIAIALSCEPRVLIADEPTTALDVTIQAQILELVRDLRQKLGMAIIWITHDLGVIAGIADRVLVMYGGEIVERAPVDNLFYNPKHAYTKALLSTLPARQGARKKRLTTVSSHQKEGLETGHPEPDDLPEDAAEDAAGEISALEPRDRPQDAIAAEPLLRVENLQMHFPVFGGVLQQQTGTVKAVDGISFDIRKGETLGLVGESGCGKSTAGRTILRLYDATGGNIYFNGEDITRYTGRTLHQFRPKMQMIFQDPMECLNPRMTVGSIISEPLDEHRRMSSAKKRERVRELLDAVGLEAGYANRYPHQFSGGQRQRIGIARALALDPEFIVCDEPIAALDVSIQAQVVNLLEDLQDKLGLTYLFISHDLSMIRHISDRVAVMYLGNIVEIAPTEKLFSDPQHLYTQALMSAVPVPDPEVERNRKRLILKGDVPSPIVRHEGFRLWRRGRKKDDPSRTAGSPLQEVSQGHFVADNSVLRGRTF